MYCVQFSFYFYFTSIIPVIWIKYHIRKKKKISENLISKFDIKNNPEVPVISQITIICINVI